MTFKSTKAIRRPNIKNLLKSLNPAFCIGRLSQESKSTFKNVHHRRGWECEERAADHLENLQYQILARRLKTPHAEVDLLVRRGKLVFLVEVKSLNHLDFSLVRVSTKQKQRLQRARDWLTQKMNSDVALAFAYVHGPDEIFLFNEVGDALE